MAVQTLAEIRARWREDTGRSDTADISDSDVNTLINEYYTTLFSSDAKVDEFDQFFTQALSATDTGIYALSQDVDRFDDPVTINSSEIVLYRDREIFFGSHGHHHHFLHGHFHGARTTLHNQFEDEQFITDPTLAIGVSGTEKVLHAAFDFEVQSKSYSKATSEVALTGSAIPAGLFGAWSLRIATDGTITVTAATGNGTGFLTPMIALDALTTSDAESAYMGYVTVTKSDGAFTPDTTALDASNVTATFTDGRFENRAEPTAALLFGQNLYLRPKPNDIYEFKAIQIAKRPTALVNDADAVADPKWGPAIARGAAIIYLESRGGQQRIADLARTSKHFIDSIRSDKIKRLFGQEIQRSF